LLALLQAGDPKAWAFTIVAVLGLIALIYFERKRLSGLARWGFRQVGRFS
jgi:hypothetical protein